MTDMIPISIGNISDLEKGARMVFHGISQSAREVRPVVLGPTHSKTAVGQGSH